MRLKGFGKQAKFLYIVLSVSSPLGILKNYIQIFLLRPFSKKIILQIHRSDITDFKETIPIIKTLQRHILALSYKVIVLSDQLTITNPLNNFKDKVFVLKNSLPPKIESSL